MEATVTQLKWEWRYAMVFPSLINKIISWQVAGMPNFGMKNEFYSHSVFHPPHQANKATVGPRLKLLEEAEIQCSLELRLKLSFKRPRETYGLQRRNLTGFLYSKEVVFPFWCLKFSLQCWWEPESVQGESSTKCMQRWFNTGLQTEGRKASCDHTVTIYSSEDWVIMGSDVSQIRKPNLLGFLLFPPG